MSLDEALSGADFVSVHVPLLRAGESSTPTFHLFNEETFHKMKRTAFLVNTSRGPVVDEDALAKALRENCALQRRLVASTQGGGQGRARERKLRKLTHEEDKLKDLLAEREENIWEKDCQRRGLKERSQRQEPWQVDSMT